MKQTKMRRKALLSSIAMLLVAVVALSSATYAWFTANTAATVHGVKLQSTSASSLLFSTSSTTGFTSNLDLGDSSTATVLTPVSSPFTAENNQFYVANPDTSATAGSAGTNENTPVASISATTSGTYTKTFYVMSGAAGTKVGIDSITAGDLAPGIRIGFRVGANYFVFAPNDSGSLDALAAETSGTLTDVTFDTLYNGTTGKGVTFAQQNISGSSTVIATLATADVAQQIDMTVWLEGNDLNCKDNLANKTLNDLSIQFKTIA